MMSMKTTAMACLLIGASMAACAKTSSTSQKTTLSLHNSSREASKVIGSINKNNYDLAIIQQKGSWVKVGNRANGQVGWIKKDSLSPSINGALPDYLTHHASTHGNHHFTTTFESDSFSSDGWHNATPQNKQMQKMLTQDIQSFNQSMQHMHKQVQAMMQNNFPIMMPGPVIIVTQPSATTNGAKQTNTTGQPHLNKMKQESTDKTV